jgi:hypothetical protein
MPKDSKKDTKASKRADDGKKRRAKKDPNAPKRGLSAYMFFSQELRQKVKDENPEASFGTCFNAFQYFECLFLSVECSLLYLRSNRQDFGWQVEGNDWLW